MKVKYYTDGSCRGNGSNNAIGAYGYIIVFESGTIGKAFAMPEKETTNQRMELKAIIAACDDAFDFYDTFDDVYIYTDSAYAHNCYVQKWYEKWQMNGWINSKKEPVANKDLWEQLIPYFGYANYHFVKTKGHADDQYNNMVDEMVQKMSANGVQDDSSNCN